MKYLRIKTYTTTKKSRKNGTRSMVPLIIEKDRKQGRITSEKALSRKRPILVTGAHKSGKTRFLERLYNNALDIWGGHSKARGRLFLGAMRPVAAWCEGEGFQEWYEALEAEAQKEKKEPLTPWKKLREWEKRDLLPQFCAEKRVIVFLDDADTLSGQKLEVACKCVVAARRWAVGASAENRLPPSLRLVVLGANPQTVCLDSEVAYDATGVLMWVLMAVAMGAGAFEVAVVLGGLKILGRGRGAAKI